MPITRRSNWARITIVPNKPLSRGIQYLGDYAPRRLQHPQIIVYEGEIKEYDFEELADKEPTGYGTTYEVKLANDTNGNLFDDVGLVTHIPDEFVPKILFDASNVSLQDKYYDLYYKITVVLPGGDLLPSTWTSILIRKTK